MTDVLDATRCPGCASIVRPGQEWCTLCHADLRPAPEPVAVEAAEAPAPADPLTAALADVTAAPVAAVGRHARRAAAEASDEAAAPAAPGAASNPAAPSPQAIDAMLAELAMQSGSPLGEVSGRLGSRSAKAVLAIGLCLGLTVLLLVGSVVLTAVFG